MKVGDIRKFNYPQRGVWECIKIKEKPNLNIDWEWDRGECPHCHKKIFNTVNYQLERIYVWKKGGDIFYTADTKTITKDGKGLHLRLPDKLFCSDKDMTDEIKEKLNGD
jgi:hypothetical protein